MKGIINFKKEALPVLIILLSVLENSQVLNNSTMHKDEVYSISYITC